MDDSLAPRFITCRAFWLDALERATKTAAQIVLILIGPAAAAHIDTWTLALQCAGSAAVLSMLSSIVSTRVGDPLSPSAVRPSQVGAGGA